MNLKEVEIFLSKLNQKDITFDSHFYKRGREIPVDESVVRSFLSKQDKLERIEYGVMKDLSFGLR